MDFYVMVNWFFLIRSITKFEIKLNEFKTYQHAYGRLIWIVKNSFKYKTFNVTIIYIIFFLIWNIYKLQRDNLELVP